MTLRIALLQPEESDACLPQLAALLEACVGAGASVGFVAPFGLSESEAFWRERMLPSVRDGTRLLLTAWLDERLVGTVSLGIDTPPNQPHRAEVSKLLVHPGHRRQGIGRKLMMELEKQAVGQGRSLLTLDTRSGDSAEPLYSGLGYRTVGPIPGYCVHPVEDRLEPTTIMYKTL